MIKKPIVYEYCITLNDICKFLSLFYDINNTDHYFFKLGRWGNIENTYADGPPYKHVREYEGLGIFKNADDHFPVIVVDFYKQRINLLDKDFINQFNEQSNRHDVEELVLTFERAFSQDFSIKSLVEDARKPVSLFDGD